MFTMLYLMLLTKLLENNKEMELSMEAFGGLLVALTMDLMCVAVLVEVLLTAIA